MSALTAQKRRRLPLNYSIIVLVVLCIFTGAISVGFSISRDHQTRQDFCEVVGGFTSTVVPSPSDPTANPSREQAYLWYARFTRLDKKLGCPK